MHVDIFSLIWSSSNKYILEIFIYISKSPAHAYITFSRLSIYRNSSKLNYEITGATQFQSHIKCVKVLLKHYFHHSVFFLQLNCSMFYYCVWPETTVDLSIIFKQFLIHLRFRRFVLWQNHYIQYYSCVRSLDATYYF